MKPFLLVILTLFTFLNTSPLSAQNTNEWTTYLENNQVKIEYKHQLCSGDNNIYAGTVFFKITNLTTTKINLSWDNKLWYDNNCINCDVQNSNDYKVIQIEANASFESDCQSKSYYNILIGYFDKNWKNIEEYPGSLTKFELMNLKIN